MIITFLVTVLVSAIYELLALNTPFNIFGSKYKYNLKLPVYKYHFKGLPLIMPLGWAVFHLAIPSIWGMILLDLLVDPLAIQAKWWKWKRKGLWFGVPLTNIFIGWPIVLITVEVIWRMF